MIPEKREDVGNASKRSSKSKSLADLNKRKMEKKERERDIRVPDFRCISRFNYVASLDSGEESFLKNRQEVALPPVFGIRRLVR